MDGSAFAKIGDAISGLIQFLAVACCVMIPLSIFGIWKIIELIWPLFQHIHITFR